MHARAPMPMKLEDIVAFSSRWLSPRPAIDAPVELREKVAAAASLGREHLRAARSAADQRLAEAAALLYGRAIACFAEARALAKPEPSGGAIDPATVVRAESELVEAPPERRDDADVLLQDPLKAVALPAGRRRRALALLEDVAARRGAELNPASDAEVGAMRVRRRALSSLLALAVVAIVVVWWTSPRNVALGKPVTASSARMGAPQGLVNGAIEWGTFAFHSGSTGHEFVTIDLVKFYSLSSAEIYSRGDGRFEFNLPLHLELSDDGTSFREAGACQDIFTQATPCVVDLHRQRARFVRLSAPEVVLTEVKVFGTP